jgi:hypothetical protein
MMIAIERRGQRTQALLERRRMTTVRFLITEKTKRTAALRRNLARKPMRMPLMIRAMPKIGSSGHALSN